MASPTNKVWKRRGIRRAAAGKWRKAQVRNKGVTPDLPLDKPNANELANAKKQKKKS